MRLTDFIVFPLFALFHHSFTVKLSFVIRMKCHLFTHYVYVRFKLGCKHERKKTTNLVILRAQGAVVDSVNVYNYRYLITKCQRKEKQCKWTKVLS